MGFHCSLSVTGFVISEDVIIPLNEDLQTRRAEFIWFSMFVLVSSSLAELFSRDVSADCMLTLLFIRAWDGK